MNMYHLHKHVIGTRSEESLKYLKVFDLNYRFVISLKTIKQIKTKNQRTFICILITDTFKLKI